VHREDADGAGENKRTHYGRPGGRRRRGARVLRRPHGTARRARAIGAGAVDAGERASETLGVESDALDGSPCALELPPIVSRPADAQT
jgi:hypothetical protein